MNAEDVLKKLQDLGVPAEVITVVQEKVSSGADLLGDIQSQGIQATLAQYGVDTSKLPNIDLTEVTGVAQDMLGIKDTDGDGKTGFAEVTETAEQFVAQTGLADEATQVKNIVSEARGIDTDGDGKTGLAEAADQAKDLASNVASQVQNSEIAQQAQAKIADIAQSDAVVQAKEMAGNIASDAGEKAQGFFSKVKSFFGV